MEEIVDEELGHEGVDAVLTKIQAIKKYVKKKRKNSTTGARMPLWLRELVDCLGSKPALPVEAGLERPKRTQKHKHMGQTCFGIHICD